MSTIRPGRPARLSASPERAASRSARSSRSATAPRRWLIKAAAAGRAACAAQDGRGGRPRQAARHRARSSGRCATCAEAGRFADGDLAAILAHQQQAGGVRALECLAPLSADSDEKRLADTDALRRPQPRDCGDLGDDRPDRDARRTPRRRCPTSSSSCCAALRLPYVRRAAPEVIATATAQRWEHAEVLRVLLAEEAAGRDQATIRMRRRASGLPAGKTFDAWEPDRSAIPPKTQRALQTLEWIDRAEVLVVCGPSGYRQEPPGRSARASRDRQRQDRRLAHARDARATAAPPPRRRQRSTRRSAS